MSFSPVIPPTIGRVVWFYPATNSAEAGFAPPPAGEPLAAVIAHVHGPAMVNLAVFDANGVAHSRTSVLLCQDGEALPERGRYCAWMPFQKGQAKAQATAAPVVLPVLDSMAAPVATDDATIEREIQAKGKTAPRVTPAAVAANIKHVEYVTHHSHGGQILRWAVITTSSGFAVVGDPSVAVSPQNDDEAIGQKVAFENSKNALWPLMGYELKSRLAAQHASIPQPLHD